jgi:hypothetical protein
MTADRPTVAESRRSRWRHEGGFDVLLSLARRRLKRFPSIIEDDEKMRRRAQVVGISPSNQLSFDVFHGNSGNSHPKTKSSGVVYECNAAKQVRLAENQVDGSALDGVRNRLSCRIALSPATCTRHNSACAKAASCGYYDELEPNRRHSMVGRDKS